MEQSRQEPSTEFSVDRLEGVSLAYEVVRGVGVALGLGLLWGLEIARDGWFRILERANIKPRRKRASAFPPGQPIKRHAA
ncbi:MAG: hypothetical protein ACREQI_05630 [Candidatus Binataceae bacterium]